MAKKIIPYNVNPQFMRIEWNGDNGIGEYGRIAFLPKSFKEKIYGEKISFVFRGVGYKDYPYHIEQRKGYYIALPVDYLNDVELKLELGEIIVKEGNVFRLEAVFIYTKKFKDKIYGSKFYKYERISLKEIEGKNSADVISWLFNVDKSIVEVCDKKLCEFEERQGYVTYVYEVFTENNIFKIKKTGQYKNYRCMPFDQLLEEFKSLKVDVEAHYTKEPESLKREGWESSYLHECLENCVWVKIKEPIYLDKCFKLTLDEFQNLREKSKIQIDELEMRKIQGMSGDDYSSAFHYWEGDKLRRHLGYYSFDEFLQHLKEYDISGIKLEIDVLKQRIDRLKDIHNYYITLDKYEIEYHLFSLSNLTRCCFPSSDIISDDWWKARNVKSLEAKIGEIINNIEFDAYIKITKDTCDTSEPDYGDYDYDDDEEYYIEEKEAMIILPNKKEITFKYNLRYVNIFKPYEKQERKEEIEYEIKDIDNDRFNKIMEEVRKNEEEVKETKNKINELEERLKEVNESSTEELYKDIISIMR